MKTIETPRLLLLTSFGFEKELESMFADPEMMKFILPNERLIEISPIAARKILNWWKEDGNGPYLIQEKESGQIIGLNGYKKVKGYSAEFLYDYDFDYML
jgi:hypothetical protein